MLASTPFADLIFTNGNIVTMDRSTPFVRALAVKGDSILAIGTEAQMRSLCGPNTQKIDLKGKMVAPGFIESHGHLISTGELKRIVNLKNLTSTEAIVEKVLQRAGMLSSHQWVTGRGWDQNLWSPPHLPTHHPLSLRIPQHPVALTRIDGHALWVNQAALVLAHIDADTPDPSGGKIVRDELGRPTGVLIDNAMKLVEQYIQQQQHNTESFLKEGIEVCLRNGITSFHDANTTASDLQAMKNFCLEGQLKLRLYTMLSGTDENLCQHYFTKGPEYLGHHQLNIAAIKLYADGALGSCGALLSHDYHDGPGHLGLTLLTEDEIYQTTLQALKSGLQVCTHAIGDRANKMVLNAYIRALRFDPNPKNRRLRIEHAQLVADHDLPRFAQFGIIASVQSSHCTSDMSWVESRLGTQRAQELSCRWRDFLNAGIHICNGSDTPIESPHPLEGFYAAITRMDHLGQPRGGWVPNQCLTRYEAMRAQTIDAAYASFEEKIKGSLSVGKLADLVVLSHDIMEVPHLEILQTKVLLTMIGGKIMYQHGEMDY